MKVIFFDLEMNQHDEIIMIGAVKYDKKTKMLDTYRKCIRRKNETSKEICELLKIDNVEFKRTAVWFEHVVNSLMKFGFFKHPLVCFGNDGEILNKELEKFGRKCESVCDASVLMQFKHMNNEKQKSLAEMLKNRGFRVDENCLHNPVYDSSLLFEYWRDFLTEE